ncbi:MAG: hypothetical protein U1E34_07205 [Amaricoccus sp.]
MAAPEPGLAAAMAHAYRHPRAAMARQIAAGLREARALGQLFLACGFGFLASLPGAIRASRTIAAEDPLAAAIAAHLFGYLFLAPLLFYGLAALIHLGARAFGARGGFLAARAALFWSALLGAPIAMALAVVSVLAEAALGPWSLPGLALLGYAGLGFWLWLLAASLAEAEGFAATGRVAAVIGGGFLCLALSLSLLIPGAPAAG